MVSADSKASSACDFSWIFRCLEGIWGGGAARVLKLRGGFVGKWWFLVLGEGDLVGLRWVRVLGSWVVVVVVEIWAMESLERREKDSLG